MIKRQALLLAAIAAGLSMTPAMAEPAGTWTVGVGVGHVEPDSDNGNLDKSSFGNIKVDHIDSDVRPTITGEYFVADNVGIEVLAALPFHHDIIIDVPGVGMTEAKTQLLPPTVSLQYHFDNVHAKVKPFIGVGANYTTFFKERSGVPGVDLDIDDSWGVAGHAGIDFKINNTDAVRLDARYIDLEPDVELNGEKAGTAKINPWVYGISYVQRF